MVSEQVRLDARRLLLLKIFQNDINAIRFDFIQTLFDAAHITNSMLVKQLSEHKAGFTNVYNAVYGDISRLIIEQIIEKNEMHQLFTELYSQRYVKAYNKYETVLSKASLGAAEMETEFQQVVRSYSKKDGIINTTKNDFNLFVYWVYSNNEIMCLDIVPDELLYEEQKLWTQRNGEITEIQLNDRRVVFTETEEPIFSSKLFSRFLERRKKELADYLNVSENKLYDFFFDNLNYDVWNKDLSYTIKPGIAGIASQTAVHVVQINHGAAQWLQTITSAKAVRKGSSGYHPDMDLIIESYYRARVMSKYIEVRNNGKPFSELTLSRECQSESIKDDYIALCYAYNIDVVYQMFRVMQKTYYENFSWEHITHQTALSRSESLIAELKRENEKKDNQIKTLSEKNADLADHIRDISNKKATPEFLQENKLNSIIEEKNREIESLKARIAIQDEFIDSLRFVEEESANHKIDIELLHTKRYLFVGYVDEMLPDLRKEFPDSVFMNSETQSIAGIKVDAVVLITNYMSHGMLYKVKSDNSLKDLPFVICNTTNIERIYQSIDKWINKSE